jgi:hypothetical protein
MNFIQGNEGCLWLINCTTQENLSNVGQDFLDFNKSTHHRRNIGNNNKSRTNVYIDINSAKELAKTDESEMANKL